MSDSHLSDSHLSDSHLSDISRNWYFSLPKPVERSAPWKLVMELGQGGYWDRAVTGTWRLLGRKKLRSAQIIDSIWVGGFGILGAVRVLVGIFKTKK